MEHSSPGFAAGLIAALDEASVSELIDKTIAEGRSIGTLNYPLRELAKRTGPDGLEQRRLLENLIPAPGFWRLLSATGDLNDLTYMLGDVSRQYLDNTWAPGNAPDVGQWQSMLQNGSFYSLARFYAEALGQLPLSALSNFDATISFEVAELSCRSSWYELSTGLAQLSQLKEQKIPISMQTAVVDRVKYCELSSLNGLDFLEACNAIKVIWDYGPERQDELAEGLLDILPKPEDWPSDYNLLIAGRLLLPIISESTFQGKVMQHIVSGFWPDPPPEAVETASGSVLAGFVWSIQGCLETLNGQHDLPAARELPAETEAALLRRRDTLTATAKANRDKMAVLSLTGALAYHWPRLRPRIEPTVRGRIRGFKFLMDETLTFSFGRCQQTVLERGPEASSGRRASR